MNTLGNLTIGMSAEMQLLVTRQMTIGYFVPGMPYVYATPIMVLHMEMAAGSATPRLPAHRGFCRLLWARWRMPVDRH